MISEQEKIFNYLKKQGYSTDRALWELKQIIQDGDIPLWLELAREHVSSRRNDGGGVRIIK